MGYRLTCLLVYGAPKLFPAILLEFSLSHRGQSITLKQCVLRTLSKLLPVANLKLIRYCIQNNFVVMAISRPGREICSLDGPLVDDGNDHTDTFTASCFANT